MGKRGKAQSHTAEAICLKSIHVSSLHREKLVLTVQRKQLRNTDGYSDQPLIWIRKNLRENRSHTF